MAARDLVIYGAGGFAVSIADLILQAPGHEDVRILAYIDDFAGGQGHEIAAAPIITLPAWREKFPHAACLISLGDPAARRRLADRAQAAGGALCEPLFLPASLSSHITLAPGVVIAYPSRIGPFTSIGKNTLIMPYTLIGHDVTIGAHGMITSSVNIAGHVVLEDEVFVGAGAVVVNGRPDRPLVIGRGAKIAAGAVVTKSVPAGATVAGNPARALRDLAAVRAGEQP
jgi:sugar O-acyltransferase (sialic acid O-acetyltransferase NeuD family)